MPNVAWMHSLILISPLFCPCWTVSGDRDAQGGSSPEARRVSEPQGPAPLGVGGRRKGLEATEHLDRIPMSQQEKPLGWCHHSPPLTPAPQRLVVESLLHLSNYRFQNDPKPDQKPKPTTNQMLKMTDEFQMSLHLQILIFQNPKNQSQNPKMAAEN
jgi:hypothetical protein